MTADLSNPTETQEQSYTLVWFWFRSHLFLNLISTKMQYSSEKNIHQSFTSFWGSEPCSEPLTQITIKFGVEPLLLGMFMCSRKEDILSHHAVFLNLALLFHIKNQCSSMYTADKFSFPDCGYLCQWRKLPQVLFETLAHSIKKQLPNEQLGEICCQITYLTHFFRQCWIAHFSPVALRNKPDAQWVNSQLTWRKDLVPQNP